jgi:hypothetical protein
LTTLVAAVVAVVPSTTRRFEGEELRLLVLDTLA